MTSIREKLEQSQEICAAATELELRASPMGGLPDLPMDYDGNFSRTDAERMAHSWNELPRRNAQLAAVLKIHRPVFAVFNWNDGLRYEEPCEECLGAKGEHPCGCWSRDEPDYRCYACETSVDAKHYATAAWPCPTVRAIEDATHD